MTEIRVATDEGTEDGRLFVPEGQGPFPLIVYFMDGGGLRAATDEMAARLVAAGYAVLAPNLFWRSGPFEPFDPKVMFTDPVQRQRAFTLIGGVKNAVIGPDTARMLDAVADPRVRTDRVGCVGYCLGGRAAFLAASALGERVAAAASIHGGHLVTDAPDSPHGGVGGIRGELYVGVADEDGSCTPAHQQALREALDAAGVRYRLELYPGARHGFAMTDFPVYDAAASERHWERILALFQANLPRDTR